LRLPAHGRIGIAAGDATVFEGATVQPEDYSRIRLNNGTRLDRKRQSNPIYEVRGLTAELVG